MNLSYSLNKQISVEKIIKDISKLCGKISQDEINSTALVISLQKISDHAGDSLLPKIAYEPNT